VYGMSAKETLVDERLRSKHTVITPMAWKDINKEDSPD